MGTTVTWWEYNGATPTESAAPNCNWQSLNDSVSPSTTSSLSPITAGNNSVIKIQALKFTSSTSAALSGLSYYIDYNPGGTPWKVVALVPASGTTFSQPSTATQPAALGTVGGSAAVTMPTTSNSLTGRFGGSSFTSSTTGPFATPTSTGSIATGGGTIYGTALYTQLQTSGSATAGLINNNAGNNYVTITAAWTES